MLGLELTPRIVPRQVRADGLVDTETVMDAILYQADPTGIDRRGTYCHSALSFVVSIGIPRINENGVRRNESTALV